MLLLALPLTASSQIVTSKKEAQKKGLYSYNQTSENSETATTGGTSSEKPVKTSGRKSKKEKRQEKIKQQNLLTENSENDFVSEYTPGPLLPAHKNFWVEKYQMF